ncbi:hypothetical protein [Francisella tularensis]|uniref:hypothetical protein n=1 Tax=Francisella tularensis TaxID=263 RepID=UPI0008F463B3|nr:hypothetical protein [Francisella tularensis]APA83230.1 hypothetical protein N894_1246 [Francisella tularensis subsp. novicida PA10-7858]
MANVKIYSRLPMDIKLSAYQRIDENSDKDKSQTHRITHTIIIKGTNSYLRDNKGVWVHDKPAETMVDKSIWDIIYNSKKESEQALKLGHIWEDKNINEAEAKKKDFKKSMGDFLDKEDLKKEKSNKKQTVLM